MRRVFSFAWIVATCLLLQSITPAFAAGAREHSQTQEEFHRWTNLMEEQWYAPDAEFPNYPRARLKSVLLRVFQSCRQIGVADYKAMSLLGFDVLRADALGFSEKEMRELVRYFLSYATTNESAMNDAQAWIDVQLENAKQTRKAELEAQTRKRTQKLERQDKRQH